MKRRNLILIMVFALFSLVTMQSCKKEAPIAQKTFIAAMPSTPVPANSTILAYTGANMTVNLSWAGTATDAIKWNVYFGKTSSPALKAENVTTNSYTASIGTKGGMFYWQVETTDANGLTTISPVWRFDVNSNPLATTLSLPAANTTAISCTPDIIWKTTKDPEGDDLTYDLYLGTSSTTPASYSSGLSDTALTVSTALSPNTDYYWKVVSKDPYGGSSTSAIQKFTTGALPIAKYTGNYNADEPAEAYSYTVSFTMVNTTTIKTTNYWNSGWTGTFTLDLTNLTYSMPFTTFQTGWTGTEAGIIDPSTGQMTGTYTIWHNGAISEQGVHTYTKI
jgi:hypothetical protein